MSISCHHVGKDFLGPRPPECTHNWVDVSRLSDGFGMRWTVGGCNHPTTHIHKVHDSIGDYVADLCIACDRQFDPRI